MDSDNTPSPGSVESPKDKRPIGRKAEKEARRKAKVAEVETSHVRSWMEQFNKTICESEARKELLEERKMMVLEETLQMEKKEAEARGREIRRKGGERQDMIMTIDTSNMDPQAKLYWSIKKREVMEQLNAQVQSLDCYRPHPPE